MELENIIEEEQIENCKKITIDTFNLEDFKKDIQLYLKSINFDKDKFILDENREYRIQTKENFTSFLIDYFKDIKENIVFDFKNHMDFDKMSIKECEEKGFRKNIIDYYFNNSLRSLGFHLNLSNEEKLNETLDEHYEDVDDSFIVNCTNCSKCDCFLNYAFDLKTLSIKTVPYINEVKNCEIEKEIDFSIELEIPSKKIVFTNYFRGILNKDRYSNFSINNYKGLVEHTRAYEKDNIGYIQVGNRSPHIYINKDKNEIIAGNYYFLEEYNEYKKDGEEESFFENYDVTKEKLESALNKLKGFKEKGYISTDLWATTFMDYDQFIDYLNKKGIKEEDYKENFFIVDINSTKIKVETNNIEYKNKDKNMYFSIKTI